MPAFRGHDGTMNRSIGAVLLAILCETALAGGHVERFYGYAFDLGTNQYAYTELHERNYVDGEWVTGTQTFFAPDGSEFGRKTLDFAKDPFLPLYTLDLSREGYMEGITDNGGVIVMTKRGARDAKVQGGSVTRDGLMVADTGFPRLLTARFDELARGETLRFRVAAVSRLEAYKFKARRIDDVVFEGRPAMRIQADMDSMLKLFAGPLVFTYDAETKRLVEYRGTSNIRNPATGEAYNVRVLYTPKPPAGVGKLPAP